MGTNNESMAFRNDNNIDVLMCMQNGIPFESNEKIKFVLKNDENRTILHEATMRSHLVRSCRPSLQKRFLANRLTHTADFPHLINLQGNTYNNIVMH